MVQRIQTVYLFIVAALFFSLFFLPFANVQSGNDLFVFKISGLHSTTNAEELTYPTWSLLTINVIIILLTFVSIFIYKRRILQIRICVYNTLLMTGFCILIGFYFIQFNKSPGFFDLKINFRLWLSFPIVAILLNYLAIRKIGADETLVRSLERLR